MFWMQALPSALFLLLLLVIPESPRFLVLKGRQGQARAVLSRLYGEAAARAKQAEIEASLEQDQHKPRFGDLRSRATGRLRPILWVGIGLAMFQQLVGINVVFYYGAVLWQAVGFSESDALLINVLSGALSIGACLLTVLLIDRIGRKPLLWVGSVGMSVALVLMVVAFASGSLAGGRLHGGPWPRGTRTASPRSVTAALRDLGRVGGERMSKEAASALVEKALHEAFGELEEKDETERARAVRTLLEEVRFVRYAPQLGDYSEKIRALAERAAEAVRRWA